MGIAAMLVMVCAVVSTGLSIAAGDYQTAIWAGLTAYWVLMWGIAVDAAKRVQ